MGMQITFYCKDLYRGKKLKEVLFEVKVKLYFDTFKIHTLNRK